MKGYCGHITHLSVAQTLRFWYFVCLFSFLFVCTSCCADFAREKWSNHSEGKLLFVYLLKHLFQHQQGWGSQKYFWCLDMFTCKFIQERFLDSSPKIFSLNFQCYFSSSVIKMPSVMSKAFRRGSRYQIGWIFGKNPNGLRKIILQIFYERYWIWLHICEEVWWPDSIKCMHMVSRDGWG